MTMTGKNGGGPGNPIGDSGGTPTGNGGKIVQIGAFRSAAHSKAEQGYLRLVETFWAHAARDVQTVLSLRDSAMNTGSRADTQSFARRLSAFRQFQEACVSQVEPSLDMIALMAFTGDHSAVEQAFRANEAVMEQLRADPSDKGYTALYLEALSRNASPVIDYLVGTWLQNPQNMHLLAALPSHEAGEHVTMMLRAGGEVDLSFLRAKYYAAIGAEDPAKAAKPSKPGTPATGAEADKGPETANPRIITFRPRPK